jgi:L,D-transpeptidase YcbB
LLANPKSRVLGEPIREREALARFYKERGGQAAWLEQPWFRDERVREPLARDLLTGLELAERHGLRADRYHGKAIAGALESAAAKPALLPELDVLLSDAFVHLARHLATGAVDPRSLHPKWKRAGEPPPDPTKALADALVSGQIAAALAARAPTQPEYAALVRELERARGDPAASFAQRAEGERRPAGAAHVDPLRANLERWRWLPRDLGRRHVRVNTPSFTLSAWDGGQVKLALRVVVGEVDSKTPLASGSITYLVLNPAWRLPRSIATREMLPAVQRDRDYFAKKGIEVWAGANEGNPHLIDPRSVKWRKVDAESFPYHLRQPPGPHNPLGQIKFAFANPYRVYLHGTPGDHAFARGLRALSHGCVRVEDETALAEFALAPDASWTRERLLDALAKEADYRLPLPEPLPVYLLYFTAIPAADGKVEYSEDPYGWDRALLDALAGR